MDGGPGAGFEAFTASVPQSQSDVDTPAHPATRHRNTRHAGSDRRRAATSFVCVYSYPSSGKAQ